MVFSQFWKWSCNKEVVLITERGWTKGVAMALKHPASITCTVQRPTSVLEGVGWCCWSGCWPCIDLGRSGRHPIIRLTIILYVCILPTLGSSLQYWKYFWDNKNTIRIMEYVGFCTSGVLIICKYIRGQEKCPHYRRCPHFRSIRKMGFHCTGNKLVSKCKMLNS